MSCRGWIERTTVEAGQQMERNSSDTDCGRSNRNRGKRNLTRLADFGDHFPTGCVLSQVIKYFHIPALLLSVPLQLCVHFLGVSTHQIRTDRMTSGLSFIWASQEKKKSSSYCFSSVNCVYPQYGHYMLIKHQNNGNIFVEV